MTILEELRRRANITQKELAQRIGVGPRTIWRWEHSEGSPPLNKARRLAAVFGVSLDFLANPSERNYPAPGSTSPDSAAAGPGEGGSTSAKADTSAPEA